MARPNLHLASVKFTPADCGGYFINAPLFLVEAFNLIEKNIMTVGIFRMAGRVTRVQLVKNAFSGDEKIPDEVSVHDVCDAVKAFFRELEEPLLSSALQNQFLRSANTIGREDVRVRTILQLCRVLSQRHKETLAFLMWRLKKVSDASHANKMDASNLALVISLSIFRAEDVPTKGQVQEAKTDSALKASVIEIMIKNADAICRLAKRSEPIPLLNSTHIGSRSAGIARKPRVNTIVGVGDLRVSTASLVERSRRKSGDWVEPASKENDAPAMTECPQLPAVETNHCQLPKGNPVASTLSTRRPWQRKLDTAVLNTSDSVEKADEQHEVPSSLSRSISDAAEKRQLNMDSGQYRRRSAGAHGKIKRGQPNTVRTGLDKGKTKPARGDQESNPAVLLNDHPFSPDLPDLVFAEPEDSHDEESEPLMQTASAENLKMEAEEAKDDFADFEFRKRELTACKDGPPQSFSRLFRSPSTPARDRPSIAYIRSRNRGRVMEQAAKYENVIQQTSNTSIVGPKSTEKKPGIPVFTQISSGSKPRCSPTKKYQTRMAVRAFNDGVKL